MKPKAARAFRLYLVTNVVNGRQYIGITTARLTARWRHHRHGSKNPRMLLHKAIAKYGEGAFTIEQIASAKNWDDLCLLGRQAIEQFRTFAPLGTGYNQTLGGEGGDASSGRKRSPEHIAAIKKAHTGKVVSAETRRRIAEGNKNRVLSPEAKARMLAGSSRSGKLSAGRPNPNLLARCNNRLGSTTSEEVRERISAAMKKARATRIPWSMLIRLTPTGARN